NQNDARTRGNSSKIGLAKSDTNLSFMVYLHLLPTLADEIIFVEKGGINANGVRNTEHPTGFKTITLEILIKSDNTTDSEVSNLIKMAEETYCPVWAMVKGNVKVETVVVIQ
ncbi:MAG: OsmC family protein, partial [Bacteroidales bacterium]|nr:OsmC family protein [Bacteroidales bacterium]